MSDKDNKDVETTTDDTTVVAEKTEEKTVGEVMENEGDQGEAAAADGKTKAEENADQDVVPIAAFLEIKKDNKKLNKEIASLQAKLDSGESSKEEIADDLSALAEEFGIEPKFVTKLTKILEKRADTKAQEAIAPIIERDKKLSKKERDGKIHEAFTTHYTAALETMPEYAEIADATTIKALSLLPENANKTFAQLIEQTYSKAVSGKRTIANKETDGGKDADGPLDFDRARKDTEYFNNVMSNPALKAEYNRRMLLPRGRHQ